MKSASLLLVLILVKMIAIWGHPVPRSGWMPIAYLWHDAAVVLLFAVFERTFRRKQRAVSMVYAVLSIYVVLNIPILRALSTPLTLPMIRATGGTIADSILYYATWQNLLLVASMLLVSASAPVFLRRISARPLIGVALLLVALGPIAATRADTSGLERNAWSALIGSALRRVPNHRGSVEWRRSFDILPAKPLTRLRGAGQGRNVILISLESTGASYLGLYGAKPDTMPHLSELARTAVVFEHAYAVYPESIKGLMTMLCSIYPAFDTPVERMSRAPCHSVPELLSERGYRTALFHSGRFIYLGMESVIRDRGFHVLADAGGIGGNHKSSFGVDEPATVSRMLEWVDSIPRGEKFLLTYLPIAGHHPYETPEQGPFTDDDDLGRYRNALHYGDAAIGTLVAGLRRRGLFDNTVWIVAGDHGEAFGQHSGNYGHTFQIYEENMRVPLVIAIPGVITKQIRSAPVVSLIDLAPTILDVLGIATPANYQGRSALAGEQSMALMFADYSQSFLGLRDGRWKFIHEPGGSKSKLFDLERDSRETTNLGEHPQHRERVRAYHEALSSWIASQRRRF